MSRQPVEVTLGGLAIRVTPCGSPDETRAVAERVNVRLRELESASHKVNTQAFALQAAYDFARELSEFRQHVADEQARVAGAIRVLTEQVEKLRAEIDTAAENGTA